MRLPSSSTTYDGAGALRVDGEASWLTSSATRPRRPRASLRQSPTCTKRDDQSRRRQRAGARDPPRRRRREGRAGPAPRPALRGPAQRSARRHPRARRGPRRRSRGLRRHRPLAEAQRAGRGLAARGHPDAGPHRGRRRRGGGLRGCGPPAPRSSRASSAAATRRSPPLERRRRSEGDAPCREAYVALGDKLSAEQGSIVATKLVALARVRIGPERNEALRSAFRARPRGSAAIKTRPRVPWRVALRPRCRQESRPRSSRSWPRLRDLDALSVAPRPARQGAPPARPAPQRAGA